MSLINDLAYLDQPEQWDELSRRCTRAGIIGLDTEFYGINPKVESPVGKATIHVFSIALRTKQTSPLGYHKARGWVLPVAALEHPGLRAVLESGAVKKCSHNQPSEDHTLANHGVKLRGAINTLNLARWMFPQLVNDGYFGLKNLMSRLLGRKPVAEFIELVSHVDEELRTSLKTRKVKICSCGEPGCRRRNGHTKTTETLEYQAQRVVKVKRSYPLQEILPGHPRWGLLVEYAAEDAVAALELEELARAHGAPQWPFEGERPAFNQALENAVVEMERTGLTIDVEWAQGTLAKCQADEAAELSWLSRWWALNRTTEYDPKVWSSHKQMQELFDGLEWPRSPIWGKGRVRYGNPPKFDNVALDWISKAHKPSAKLIGHILHLKKVRAGKKYLQRLVDSGGKVHVICGPAGDSDDRNGAVSGRLGIKGALAAAQLPKKIDRDLYKIRRGIVAPPGMVLVVADETALEVVILADLTKRLFGDTELELATAPGAPDFHSTNVIRIFGDLLGYPCPAQWDGKPCDYSWVRDIPVAEVKKHPYAAFLRDLIKAVFYGFAYGKRGYGFATLSDGKGGMIGEDLGNKLCEGLTIARPSLGKFEAWVKAYVDKHHAIYSLDGRWADLSHDIASGKWGLQRAYRRALNFPCQAAAAGIIGDVMVLTNRCPDLRRLGFKICLQVHDEIVMVGPEEGAEEAAKLLKHYMETATANGVQLLVPLTASVSYAKNYLEAK